MNKIGFGGLSSLMRIRMNSGEERSSGLKIFERLIVNEGVDNEDDDGRIDGDVG